MSLPRKALRHITNSNTASHAGLWLDKYMGIQEPGLRPADPPLKPEVSLVIQMTRIPQPPGYKAFFQRWETVLRTRTSYVAHARAEDRLAVGLGAEGVLETAIALHHTYGLPYLPGSALKGLAAAYTRQRLGISAGSDTYQTLFGDTTSAGYITFFDALYVPNDLLTKPDTNVWKDPLHPDVIAVHHPQYYQGSQPPADWDDPTPVPFVAATGTYLVALAGPPGTDIGAWVYAAMRILKQALAEMGIGAKTSSGYGRMALDLSKIAPPPAAAKVTTAVPNAGKSEIAEASTAAAPNQLPAAAPLADPTLRVSQNYQLGVLRLPEQTGDGSVELAIEGYSSEQAIGRIDSTVLDRQYQLNTKASVIVQNITHVNGRWIVNVVPKPRKEKK